MTDEHRLPAADDSEVSTRAEDVQTIEESKEELVAESDQFLDLSGADVEATSGGDEVAPA